jgi:hypothetical protein
MAEIVTAHVFHARSRPRRNAFRYGVYYIRFVLEEFLVPAKPVLFSIDRFNLFSFYHKDYQDGAVGVQESIRATLHDFAAPEADGEIQLITMPRILGYAFNPVSFFLCHDKAKNLRAVIAMVNNTFGERHRYFCCHPDRRPINAGDWLEAQKIFHVSPFLAVEGIYRFRFACTPEGVEIWINHCESGEIILSTSLVGAAQPLGSGRLLFCFFRYPLVMFKVVALIHYQAVRLFLKGVQPHRKPAPPLTDISQ